ncbi:MAG: hypothetical protein IJI57_13605 [Flexilinea sp.]|nr:hypothetical protein [Flexilinea sp.]
MIDLLNLILQNQMLRDFMNEAARRIKAVDWMTMFKVCGVMVVSMLLVSLLVLINDRMYEASINRRMKIHHLTIRNDGNSPSVYLLHTVDLPSTLAVRFRIDGNPMIWVSFDTGRGKEPDQLPEQVQQAPLKPEPVNDDDHVKSDHSNLVPNLNDPLKPVQTVTKTASEVGKKAGFFASILSTLSVLLPFIPSPLKEAQSALKGVQQDANTLVGQINTKTNAVSTLGDQLGKLPGADTVGKVAQSSGVDPQQMAKDAVMNDANQAYRSVGAMKGSGNADDGNLILGNNFVYDEEIWRRNIGKVDDNGGALNYAQSKVLEPGESMKIDIELMNLSESPAPVSQLYKIEVVQVPQTRLHLSSVSRFLNGIVMFEKVSELSRVMPSVISFVLILAAVQIIAGFTYLIF